MTADEIIDGLLAREGGWRDQVERPDGTIDPATNKGITLPTLRRWRQRAWQAAGGHGASPSVTEAELRNLSDDEAFTIYVELYIMEPGFTTDNIPYEPLRVQLIDFGVNSGPERAVRWLQRVLGLQATGTLNRQTLQCLQYQGHSFMERPLLALVNDALVAARSYMIDQAVDQGIMRRQDEEGVESRALSFFLARP